MVIILLYMTILYFSQAETLSECGIFPLFMSKKIYEAAAIANLRGLMTGLILACIHTVSDVEAYGLGPCNCGPDLTGWPHTGFFLSAVNWINASHAAGCSASDYEINPQTVAWRVPDN